MGYVVQFPPQSVQCWGGKCFANHSSVCQGLYIFEIREFEQGVVAWLASQTREYFMQNIHVLKY